MVFFPPSESPSFPIHRRPHISPVCGLVRIRTRRLLHANHESRTGTKPERLATRTHQRAFMDNVCHEPVKTCCKSGLHASALRRSYIPIKWGIARYRSRLHAPALWRRSYFPTLAADVWYIGWRGREGIQKG